MITRYGYDVFFTLLFIEPKSIRYGVAFVAFVFLALTVNFFRDPERTTPRGDRMVIAPADGKILHVKNVQENEFFKSEAKLISIFMSPLNVHVNRNPISGVVKHTRYVEGEYFAAFEDKASEKNEQMIVGLEGAHGKVMFKQIAGFVARRIVCTLNVGDTATAGVRFGMIKFGSRVDVYVPVTANVNVKVGDVTAAGETVLAEFVQ
jgi:phosphatidylserine decarboxylase